jgi:hypothetical protein
MPDPTCEDLENQRQQLNAIVGQLNADISSLAYQITASALSMSTSDTASPPVSMSVPPTSAEVQARIGVIMTQANAASAQQNWPLYMSLYSIAMGYVSLKSLIDQKAAKLLQLNGPPEGPPGPGPTLDAVVSQMLSMDCPQLQ